MLPHRPVMYRLPAGPPGNIPRRSPAAATTCADAPSTVSPVLRIPRAAYSVPPTAATYISVHGSSSRIMRHGPRSKAAAARPSTEPSDQSIANFRARSSSSGTYSPAKPKHRAASATHTPAAISRCVPDIPGRRGSDSTGLQDQDRPLLGGRARPSHSRQPVCSPEDGHSLEAAPPLPALFCATYSCNCRPSAMSARLHFRVP
ncbi:hypothetical protein FKM82_024755 [Ascaphus truei]